mgnify:CR=1 FL=1
MKKAKRVTKRQKKQAAQFMKELMKSQPQITQAPKTSKSNSVISLTDFLNRQAQKKHDKKHERQERNAAKAPALKKAATKMAKEIKRANRAKQKVKKAARK